METYRRDPYEIQPFMFEPVDNNNDDRNSGESLNDTSRTEANKADGNDEIHEIDENGEWCSCGACSEENLSAAECVCCKSWDVLAGKLEDLNCIAQHEEFGLLCLNRTVLTAIWLYIMAYRKQRGRIPAHLNNRLVTMQCC